LLNGGRRCGQPNRPGHERSEWPVNLLHLLPLARARP
jgi:hypothetical protein